MLVLTGSRIALVAFWGLGRVHHTMKASNASASPASSK